MPRPKKPGRGEGDLDVKPALAPDGLPKLSAVIAENGLSARKALGQNFLLDLNLTGRVARASGPLEDATVVEIGPGPGGLTRALLAEGAANVVAIERDDRCLPALEQIAERYPGQLTVLHGDAMRTDLTPYLAPNTRIVANLPYNVGTALLTTWLECDPWPPWWDSLTLMFQREVAERLVAQPGTKAYGRLSILAQWRSSARICFDVPAAAFTPPPKVTSSVVHIRPKAAPDGIVPKLLSTLTGAAFSQRRKMLRQSLKPLCKDASALLEAADIEPTRRAETLSIAECLALCRVYQASLSVRS